MSTYLRVHVRRNVEIVGPVAVASVLVSTVVLSGLIPVSVLPVGGPVVLAIHVISGLITVAALIATLVSLLSLVVVPHPTTWNKKESKASYVGQAGMRQKDCQNVMSPRHSKNTKKRRSLVAVFSTLVVIPSIVGASSGATFHGVVGPVGDGSLL